MILKKTRPAFGSRTGDVLNGAGRIQQLLRARPGAPPDRGYPEGSFEAFAQHAFDTVFQALQQANEKVERLTVERDDALARLTLTEARVSNGTRLQASLARGQRPWQALLSHTPQEPAGRTRWTVALTLLTLLPVAGIEIARSWLDKAFGRGWSGTPPHDIALLLVLGLVAILFLAAMVARRSR